jgi:uncharacterized protein YjbI with pentapeptide repeats
MHADYITDQNFTDLTYAESDVKYKEYENCTFTNCDFRMCSFIAVTFIDCNLSNVILEVQKSTMSHYVMFGLQNVTLPLLTLQ